MKNEEIIMEFINLVEYELDELMLDINESGMTDFLRGEGYGFIVCLEMLKLLLSESASLLNYDIEDKYKKIL